MKANTELEGSVVESHSKPRGGDDADWFFIPEPRAAARLRLFCFPYAGGWPWAFRAWSRGLAPDVETCAVYLPSRGRRAKEAMPARMDTLVNMLRTAMQSRLDRPYALFGHSFGALLAFELATQLEGAGDPPPERLFVSGCSSPLRRANGLLHELPDDRLISVLRDWGGASGAMLENPEILALTLSMVRMDLKLAARHVPRVAVVGCPITAFFGRDDRSAGSEAAAEWKTHTRSSFGTQGFAGGHFFFHDEQAALLVAVQRGLA